MMIMKLPVMWSVHDDATKTHGGVYTVAPHYMALVYDDHVCGAIDDDDDDYEAPSDVISTWWCDQDTWVVHII